MESEAVAGDRPDAANDEVIDGRYIIAGGMGGEFIVYGAKKRTLAEAMGRRSGTGTLLYEYGLWANNSLTQ